VHQTTWLLDGQELEIRRIAAVDSPAYWNCFVYLEVAGARPSGAYSFSDKELEHMRKTFGYCWEEVCVFRNQFLKRTFYDDGAAEIDGQIVDLGDEAELRTRYLSSYNLIIAAQDSGVNDNELDIRFEALMNEILERPAAFDQLAAAVRKLPKRLIYIRNQNAG
jgi:hypothetical protein